MKYRPRFLQLAQDDLFQVIDYISEHSLKAADDFLDSLDERLSQICEFPKSCEVYRHNPTLRRLIIGSYLAFYEVDEENKFIKVYRILHGSRNIDEINFIDDADN